MSKFIDAIQSQIIDSYKRPVFYKENLASNKTNNLHCNMEVSKSHITVENTYKFSVEYSQKIICEPQFEKQALNSFIDKLQDVIYGQFIEHLYDLEISILQKDQARAMQQISNIINEVKGGK